MIYLNADVSNLDADALLSQNSADLLQLLSTQKESSSSSDATATAASSDGDKPNFGGEDNKIIARIDTNLRQLSKCALLAQQFTHPQPQSRSVGNDGTGNQGVTPWKKEEPLSS